MHLHGIAAKLICITTWPVSVIQFKPNTPFLLGSIVESCTTDSPYDKTLQCLFSLQQSTLSDS